MHRESPEWGRRNIGRKDMLINHPDILGFGVLIFNLLPVLSKERRHICHAILSNECHQQNLRNSQDRVVCCRLNFLGLTRKKFGLWEKLFR
jgi:hypothetical protein